MVYNISQSKKERVIDLFYTRVNPIFDDDVDYLKYDYCKHSTLNRSSFSSGYESIKCMWCIN